MLGAVELFVTMHLPFYYKLRVPLFFLQLDAVDAGRMLIGFSIYKPNDPGVQGVGGQWLPPQLSNADSPMDVTLSGMVMLTRRDGENPNFLIAVTVCLLFGFNQRQAIAVI